MNVSNMAIIKRNGEIRTHIATLQRSGIDGIALGGVLLKLRYVRCKV